MKLIGEIENISYNGIWILHSENVPKIGSSVYNQQKQFVGKIVNIIGPVNRPYILVRPRKSEKDEQLQIIGEKVYIKNEGKNRRKKQMR
ncbi:MAG: hypothetical protein JSV49_08525 [Thermoplasmata archaeon]|nr:MAG: hypothetical protein JSV49_08525 [Thermoplasmata archaeon]